MTVIVTPGSCKLCDTLITKIFDPSNRVLYADGRRYQYTKKENQPKVYCIFRCEGCGEPIDDNWVSLEQPTKKGEHER